MKNITYYAEIFLPIITVVISSVVSYFVAKMKAQSEIDKIMLSLSHKDEENFTHSYTHLLSSVAQYCSHPDLYNREAAQDACADFLSVAPPTFHSLLTELDYTLNSGDKLKLLSLREKLISLYSEWAN